MPKKDTADMPASVNTGYTNKTVNHPAQAALPYWGDSDAKTFSRFRFVFDEEDNSTLLVVNTSGNEYAPVYHGKYKDAMLATLTGICSGSKATDGKYKNLYQEVVEGYKAGLTAVTDAFRNRDLRTTEDFIVALSKVAPCTMLHELSISCMVHTLKRKKPAEKEGEPSTEETFLVPFHTELRYNKAPLNPIEFLVHFYGKMVARSELRMEMPRIYSNNPEEPAFNHLDLDSLVSPGEYPTWKKWLGRFQQDEGEAFMGFTWGIFDADNTGRQMLYIEDAKGLGGKTMVQNVIADYLGSNLVASLQKDSLGNQFAMAKIWNKRLVCIDDNKNPRLIWGEKMHVILGHGLAEVEQKGKDSFTSRLQCKVMANGNIPLEIHPDAMHETSRLIVIRVNMTDGQYKEFCELDENGELKRDTVTGNPIPIMDPSFEDNLRKEMPHFLYACREIYARVCPKRANIMISDRMRHNLISNAPIDTMVIEDVFNNAFEISPGAMVSAVTFHKKFDEGIQDLYQSSNKADLPSFSDFKDYIKKRNPEVDYSRRVWFGSRAYRRQVRVVTGIRLLGGPDTELPAEELDDDSLDIIVGGRA